MTPFYPSSAQTWYRITNKKNILGEIPPGKSEDYSSLQSDELSAGEIHQKILERRRPRRHVTDRSERFTPVQEEINDDTEIGEISEISISHSESN